MGNNVFDEIQKKFDSAIDRLKRDLPRIAGKTAVDHFRENFDKEGFVDGGLHKWKDVKRRDSSSPWYGFDYRGKKVNRNGPMGEKGKERKGKKKGNLSKAARRPGANFSKAATQRSILSGPSHELKRSLKYTPNGTGVIISSDKPYAQIQNDGGQISVFGHGSATLPARPFVGKSRELENKLGEAASAYIDKLMNK